MPEAFESVMKSICDRRGWTYGDRATAKSLIKVCFDNEIVPAFWQSHFSSLCGLLESGVPTGRNKLSGHGQGAAPTTVPDAHRRLRTAHDGRRHRVSG